LEAQRKAASDTRSLMNVYFERIKRLSQSDKLESRLRFMLLDVIDQRARGWEDRRKKEGPKKIEVCACVCACACVRVCVSVCLRVCI
jgi:translation initiation factor 4G